MRPKTNVPEPVAIEAPAPATQPETAPAVAAPVEAAAPVPPAPRVHVISTTDRRQIVVSFDAGEGKAWRARCHKVGAPGYFCSGWAHGGASIGLAVDPGCTYRVGYQIHGGQWIAIGNFDVPRLGPLSTGPKV